MVSILLAAYNGERHLPQQLDSLRMQTLQDFRVLWQDDGSSDGTAALLTAAADDSRFQPGAQQGLHLGAAGNFISLMRQDDAPYSALCDQDDVWHPGKLASCLRALKEAEAHFSTDTPLLVHHDCRVTDVTGAVLHSSFFRHQGWDPAANTLPRLLVQNNVTGCTCMMNAALRQLVAEHARADRLFMHDWFITLTATAFGHIIFVDEPLLDYRQHGHNVLGASRHGILRRGIAALHAPEQAQERIRLTYRHARAFRDLYGAALPASAADVVNRYIAIEEMPKLQRIAALQKGGFLMQSFVTRMGQRIFT